MDKQHILDEIKRTAEANGGKPLGRLRFFQETGIKETDWLGKYWARWSDAVLESGFEPNQLQSALDEHEVIAKLIELMRELRKFPTANEVKLKARAEIGFPWPTTFKRFGSKQQLAARVQEYCAAHDGYDDVVAFCASVTDFKQLAPSHLNVESEPSFGFVYLMKSGSHFKIGRTNHVGGRERDLSIQLPEKVNTVHSIRTDDPVGIEAYWHNRFKAKRKNGEWFELDSSDISAFKRRKFM